MRARSPHGLFPSAVPPLTDEHQRCESRWEKTSPQGIPPELSNLINQVLATERFGPLRRGDFVLCTTNLRSWIAADAMHLHHAIFIKTANSVCRGAGDSHLPRNLRARSPMFFPLRQGRFHTRHDRCIPLHRNISIFPCRHPVIFFP